MTYQRTILVGGGLILACIIVSILTFILSQGPCPRTSFQCDNGRKCVTQMKICDNNRDCDDGEDEHPVTCGLLYGGISVLEHQRNQSLLLPEYGHCYYYLEGCARQCDPVPIMLCHNRELTHIPPIIYDNMTAINQIPHLGIYMENNRLILEEDTLENVTLSYLDISYNNLSSIPATAFAGQRHLKKLYLNGNNIEEIKSGSFSGLTQLEWLYLDNNKLTMFPFEDLASNGQLVWLNLSNNCLRLDGDPFPPLKQLWDLYLDNNRIQVIGLHTFAKLNQLEVLNLSHNRISVIHSGAFKNLRHLRDLRLAHNQLSTLPDNFLQHNHHLQSLYLNHNPQINITFAAYGELPRLRFLELAGIKFHQINFDSINALSNLKFAIYDKFHYCSMTPHIIKCKPNTDGISSYSNLLENSVLRYSAWLMALLTCLGNPLVLWIRVPKPGADNQHASTLVRNLAIADLFMGFYLLIISVQDLRFRDVYHKSASDWVGSWACAATGIVAMVSAEVSLLILAFISMDRFLMIADPCGCKKRTGYRKVAWPLVIIWMLGTIISIVPAIYYQSTSKFYGIYSGTCFPLHIEELFPLGWQYSAFVFFGVNVFLLIVIGALSMGLLHSIRKTSRATTLPYKDVDLSLTIRFFFIVVTSASCWVGIMSFKLFSMFGYEFGTDLYAFVVVYLLPLNSAVNPLLYTFTAPDYWKRIMTKDWRTILKVKSENHHILTNGNCGSGNETQNGGGGGTNHYYSNQEDSNGKIVPSFNGGKARSSGVSQKF